MSNAKVPKSQRVQAIRVRTLRMPLDRLHKLALEEPGVAENVGRQLLHLALTNRDLHTFGDLHRAIGGAEVVAPASGE